VVGRHLPRCGQNPCHRPKDASEGRHIIVVGEKKHPEIEAISSWCDDCVICETPEELQGCLKAAPALKTSPVSVVFQTTNTREVFENCSKTIKKELYKL
jgi:4-hydroxy-3-methylbut-2-enyl diphosphate reductase